MLQEHHRPPTCKTGRLGITHTQRPRAATVALTISDQDLAQPSSSRTSTSFAKPDIDTVVVALGGAPGDDVLPLLQANGPMMKVKGGQAWLHSLGITPELRNWY